MLDPSQKNFQQAKIKNWLCDHVLRARFHFEFKAPNFFIEIGQPWVGSHSDHKSSSHSNGIATEIESPIQVVHNIDQANRVYIEHSRRVGIISHLGWIAGDADQISDSDRCRAQQIALNAQYVTISTGVVQDGIDAHLPLNEQRERLVAHARRSARTIRNIHAVHAY